MPPEALFIVTSGMILLLFAAVLCLLLLVAPELSLALRGIANSNYTSYPMLSRTYDGYRQLSQPSTIPPPTPFAIPPPLLPFAIPPPPPPFAPTQLSQPAQLHVPNSSAQPFEESVPAATLRDELNTLWRGDLPLNNSDATISLSRAQYYMFEDYGQHYSPGTKLDLLLLASLVYKKKMKNDDDGLTSCIASRFLGKLQEQAARNCEHSKNAPCIHAFWKFKLVTYLGKSILVRTEKKNYVGKLVDVKSKFAYSITLRVSEDREDYEVDLSTALLADGTVTIEEEHWDAKYP
ncbi:hypothetical protein EJ07DRAFT_159283 [Lizonia empirigonia]|nr:hypothetical protein EJ07DRAFT_159283 [Lizonia empirigonia]